MISRLNNSTSIPINETLPGHLVFEDPLIPAISIIRTSKSTGSRQVWPFGQLYEPSLVSRLSFFQNLKALLQKRLNEILLDFDIDERQEPEIWIESIQLPSYNDYQRFMKKFRELKRLQALPNLET